MAQRNAAFLLEKLRADGRSGTAGASRFLAGWGAVKAAAVGGDATADESAAALAELSRLAVAGGKEGKEGGTCSAGEGKEEGGKGAAAAAFTARRSRAWLERAAAQGSIDAMVLLGDLHYYGDIAAMDAAAAAAADGAAGSGGGGTVVALKGAGERATRAQEATGRAAAARWYVAACRASEGGRSRSRADYRGLASDARARWNLAWMHLVGAPMGEDAKKFRCRRGRGGGAAAAGAAVAEEDKKKKKKKEGEEEEEEEDADLVAALHFLEESLQRDRTGLATVLGPVLTSGGTRVLGIWRTMLRWMPGVGDDPVAMATGLLRRLGMSWGGSAKSTDDG